MNKFKFASCIALVLLLSTLAVLFAGCANDEESSTDGMILVIYDGNGGYLGNKSSTTRRLFCTPGSKLPSYSTKYESNQYTVSSLGLANKAGYRLAGWYVSSNQNYQPSEYGGYVFLDKEMGNGILTQDENGMLVMDYQLDENGAYIFVFVEKPAEESDSAEGNAEATEKSLSYIYLKSAVTDGDKTYEAGFYIYSDEIVNQLGDAARTAFESAHSEKVYAEDTVKEWSGYQRISKLSDEQTTLFSELPRYRRLVREAGEADSGKVRYALYSEYVSLDAMMEEDENGDYVRSGKSFYYFPDMTLVSGRLLSSPRYSIADRYLFTRSDTVKSPTDLERYDASFRYWSFENDRVTSDLLDENGRLVLYAHWVKKTTVYYHYENGNGQVDEATMRRNAGNTEDIEIVPGGLIGKKEIIPLYAGHTFVGWSRSATEYQPWNYDTDVFPEDESELHLYAFYIEGEYSRIVNKNGLAKIGSNPAGKYLLCNDIDLGGQKYANTSPTGLNADKTFTGEFVSFGNTISNFTLTLSATKSKYENLATALFPKAEGATIKGVNVDCAINIGAGNTLVGVTNLNLTAAGIVGIADAGTTVTDCGVKILFSLSGIFKPTVSYTLSIGDLLGTGGSTAGECAADTNLQFVYSDAVAKGIATVKNPLSN